MKESLKLYKILSGILLLVMFILVLSNILLVKLLNSKVSIETSRIKPVNIVEEKYGYKDILNIVYGYNGLKILSTDNNEGNKKNVKLNIGCNNDLKTLQKVFDKLIKEPCFKEIENIKIDKSKSSNLTVNFTARFIKNK